MPTIGWLHYELPEELRTRFGGMWGGRYRGQRQKWFLMRFTGEDRNIDLATEHPDLNVVALDPLVCPCSTMFRIDAAHLAWVLEHLAEGEVVNRITVDAETATWARVALQRMLDIT